jgi:hypothetical protein
MRVFWAILAAGLLLAVSASSLRAQNYSIDWYKIGGGGGTSTNTQYVLNGTIGQADAGGPMTGGNYSLTSGFWSLLSVLQTPNAPTLRIFFTSTNTAVVAWPTSPFTFNLLQNTNVATTNWVSVPSAVNVVGGENQVIISPPAGRVFYRLKYP